MFVVDVAPHLTPFAYEAITVSSSAKKLDTSKITPSDFKTLGKARLVKLTVEGKVRYREDGTAPTSTEGHLLQSGDVYVMAGFQQMSNFTMILENGEQSDAKVRVTYYR